MDKDQGQLPRLLETVSEKIDKLTGSVARAIGGRSLAEYLIDQKEEAAINNAYAYREIAQQLGEKKTAEDKTKEIASIEASRLDRRVQSDGSLIGNNRFSRFRDIMNEIPEHDRNFMSLELDDDQIERLGKIPALHSMFIDTGHNRGK